MGGVDQINGIDLQKSQLNLLGHISNRTGNATWQKPEQFWLERSGESINACSSTGIYQMRMSEIYAD